MILVYFILKKVDEDKFEQTFFVISSFGVGFVFCLLFGVVLPKTEDMVEIFGITENGIQSYHASGIVVDQKMENNKYYLFIYDSMLSGWIQVDENDYNNAINGSCVSGDIKVKRWLDVEVLTVSEVSDVSFGFIQKNGSILY